MIISSIDQLIGHTPLMALDTLMGKESVMGRVLAKLEMQNPLHSVKDRAALYMIRAGIASGKLKPGGIIVEPTSGNTGIGLAYLGRLMGYPVTLTMPESMSEERKQLLAALGAQLVLTPAKLGMAGAIAEAQRIADETPGAFMPNQFDSPANAQAHYEGTGPEIWADSGGKLDALICGVGSGGTITGAGRFLKQQNPAITAIAVEPAESAVLSGQPPQPHRIQGIGAGFIPKTLDRGIIDEIITVSGEEAFAATRLLYQTEGIFAGVSSGAAVRAALHWAARPENAGKTAVCILPDSGEKYISFQLYQQAP